MAAHPITGPQPSCPGSAGAPAPSVTAASAAGAVSAPESPATDEPQLDANKLHCYQVALELHTQCSLLVSVLQRVVRDQLERASLSVVLNIAEAGGRRSRRDKARFYAIARGSATEVAALLDILSMRRLAPPAVIARNRRLAIRVVQMLTRVHQSLTR